MVGERLCRLAQRERLSSIRHVQRSATDVADNLFLASVAPAADTGATRIPSHRSILMRRIDVFPFCKKAARIAFRSYADFRRRIVFHICRNDGEISNADDLQELSMTTAAKEVVYTMILQTLLS